jgi:alpha-ketoglutarate-dependent taurine dioxygenase
MTLSSKHLNDVIGTEVRSDIDTLLLPETGCILRRLLVERGVLVFRELALSDEQQVVLASHMGTVRVEGEKGIFKITIDPEVNTGAAYLKGSFLWHMDGTHDDVPVFASLLTGLVLSKVGGQTEFANSYAAYEALPDDMKVRTANLRVVHDFKVSMERAGVISQSDGEAAFIASIPVKTHSLVWTHKCGRKSLVIGCHASHVEGMDFDEGRALLAELMAWVTQPRFSYRHEWTVGDLLIWDNTGVLHRAEPYPVESGRIMHRTTLMGEEAFA